MHSLAELLRVEFGTRPTPMPRTVQQLEWWTGVDCVVVVRDRPEPVDLDEATRSSIVEFVARGGRLLLFGFGAGLVHELGIEPERPSRREHVAWGDDDRTAIGLLQFGFTATQDVAGLTEELRAFPREPASFLISGGECVELQLCEWRDRPPQTGETLGLLCELRDRDFAPRGGTVLARWTVGRGVVMACGFLPEPARAAPAVAENARAFVRNAVHELCGDVARPRVRLCVEATEADDEVLSEAYRLARLSEREHPGALLVPHWGWQVAANHLRDGRAPIAPRDVYDRVLLPSFRAGATLVDLQLADSRDGYPFAWDPRDSIARPASFHGGAFWPGWNAAQIALLAREAHHRGMWLSCWLHPSPLSGTGVAPSDWLSAAKWWAREFADVRTVPGGALDGFGVHRWFDDPHGATSSVLRLFQPSMFAYCTRPTSRALPGFVNVVDADRGRPAGAPAAGVSARWRNVFPPHEYLCGVLDGRLRRPSAETWGADAESGGGSYPDWLVTQLGDFARSRAMRGAAFWWRAHNPSTLGAHTEEYVAGLSLDPLKAAVAGRLTATGVGGYRDLCARLLGRVQSGFGAETELPAEMPFLQNNHLRLHGTAGPLWFDPDGVARYHEGDARLEVVAKSFMSTHVRGFRPSVSSVQSAFVDFIGARPRGAGGYDRTVLMQGEERGGDVFPAVLAREATPEWPAHVGADFTLTRGRYALDLTLLGRADRGILEVRMDGEVVALTPFEVGEGTKHHSVRVDLAEDGAHRLDLELVHGGAVSVSQCRLTRVDDRAGQTLVSQRAGFCAELIERSSSTYFSETASVRTIADFAGFVWKTECVRAARNAQVVRKFSLPHHRSLRVAREGSERLRSPFVLASDRPGLPDLAVIPLSLPAQARFRVDSEGSLELIAYPRPHQQCAVGFVLLRDHDVGDLASLGHICTSIALPTELRIEVGATARLDSKLDVHWPRLVRVVHSERVPMMVRERGAWHVRGTQPTAAGDGSRWLRVYHGPGESVEVRPWDPERLPVRTGPGSLHSIVMQEAGEHHATVEVLQTGPLLAAPSVEFLAEFDRVTLNGEPWCFFDQRRVYLPCEPGRYEIRTRTLGQAAQPRVLATRALVRRCTFDESHRVLEFSVTKRPEDPDDTAYTAWISAEGEFEVTGRDAVRVPERSFGYRDDVVTAGRRRGSIVRFRPGLVRVRLP